MVVVYAAFAFLLARLYRAYRRERAPHLVGIIVGQVAFFLGLLNDGLVADGAYVAFYVTEYAYLVVIATMAYALLGRLVDLHASIDRLNGDLERRVARALADIKVLRGLIPICSACKRIRDDRGFWTRLEQYLSEHSEATLTHGICPECAQRLYPEIASRRRRSASKEPTAE